MYEELSSEEIYHIGIEFEANEKKALYAARKSGYIPEIEQKMRTAREYSLKAQECFLILANRGHAQAQYALAVQYDNWRDKYQEHDKYEDAFSWALQAAQQGHGEACDMISEYYRLGKLSLPNEEKSEYWRKQAIRNRSSLQETYVRGLVAGEYSEKAKKVLLIRICLYVLEFILATRVTWLACLVGVVDILLFEDWAEKHLCGYPYISPELGTKCAIAARGILIVYSVFNRGLTLLVIAACGYRGWLRNKGLRDNTRSTKTYKMWDDPSTWDWEKYAQ